MKAILVIDFPDDYGDVNDNKAIVTLRNGKLGTSLGIYNVPLKPFPKEEDIYEVGMDEEDTNAKRQWNKGWDACLKEIEE